MLASNCHRPQLSLAVSQRLSKDAAHIETDEATTTLSFAARCS
jgi:hypothetical protein